MIKLGLKYTAVSSQFHHRCCILLSSLDSEKSNLTSFDSEECRGEWRSIALVKYHSGKMVEKGILFDFYHNDYTELKSGVS